jgi:hypothetical protein
MIHDLECLVALTYLLLLLSLMEVPTEKHDELWWLFPFNMLTLVWQIQTLTESNRLRKGSSGAPGLVLF